MRERQSVQKLGAEVQELQYKKQGLEQNVKEMEQRYHGPESGLGLGVAIAEVAQGPAGCVGVHVYLIVAWPCDASSSHPWPFCAAPGLVFLEPCPP